MKRKPATQVAPDITRRPPSRTNDITGAPVPASNRGDDLATCAVCGSRDLESFLYRRGVPVHQNMVMESVDAAVGIGRGDLEMAFCSGCGFVFNAAFDPGKLCYSESYDNNQAHSGAFRSYLDELVDYLVTEAGVRGRSIVDVGCGNGDFLRRLVHDPALNNRGYGFDPAYRGRDIDCDGRARFVRSYYGPEFESVPADVVVCRHVIEHVPDPVQLLKSVRRALEGSDQARVFFETPDVSWILRYRVIWDFFYEHCSLFSPHSLSVAFERAGFHVTGVRRAFGGQYLWLEAATSPPRPLSWPRCHPEGTRGEGENMTSPPPPTLLETTTGADASNTLFTLDGASHRDGVCSDDIVSLSSSFAGCEEQIRVEWYRKLQELGRIGKVALWGAGAKGVTLANLLDPNCERIDCVVDLNPNKQGRFLPGSGHPIVDFRELPGRGVRSAVLMNPNYLDENRRLLSESKLDIELIG